MCISAQHKVFEHLSTSPERCSQLNGRVPFDLDDSLGAMVHGPHRLPFWLSSEVQRGHIAEVLALIGLIPSYPDWKAMLGQQVT
mmetsp:Transcript_67614/g.111972  ORF Transcript_67614/g.111972 Transcript_67614/m.111972 type:complete len:84 (-) Transcript_67614:91-342(-)